MKLTNTTAAIIGAALLSASAAAAVYEPAITAMDMARSEQGKETLYVSYTLDRASWKVPSNTEVIITPVVRFANDSVELQPVILAGRAAYIAHKRNGDLPKDADLLRATGDAITRTAAIDWQPAMEQSTLTFRTETRGCRCKEEGLGLLPEYLAMDFAPKHFDLIIPGAQLAAMEQKIDEIVKTRSLSKHAYVNYKVGSTILLPDFKSNPVELANILATIDSVRADKDLTVDHVLIHGYASPEGSYALNKKLAEGRTEALRKYVDQHYGFGRALTTASTPEDWEGLKKWVEDSQLAHKDGILEVINSSMEPDAKDNALKTRFPSDYAIMLSQAYPTLRRSDYRIEYTVRNYTEPATIAKMLQTAPQKLSIEELMLLARTFEEGSDERLNLMARGAELFPDDQLANLYAAFVALKRDDLAAAGKLLRNAGTSPVAQYARGVLALYEDDMAKAKPLLVEAAAAGVEGASEALTYVKEK